MLFLIIFLGLSYLCMGIKKHYIQALASTLHHNNISAISVGCLLLVIALVVAIKHLGVGMGIVYYLGFITLTHLLVIILICYLPKQLSIITGFYWLFKQQPIPPHTS
ncbi:DUF3325 family protein [Entomomonas asaccharolytica]